MSVMDFVERLLLSRSQICIIRVVATTRLTPHMLRVEFAGEGLARFDDPANLHVRLLLPPAGASRADWLGADGTPAGHAAPVYRKYTIRRIDPAAGRVWIDFVLHGDTGPGSEWAARAAPGDALGMIGPGGRGIGPADWHLIAGDETALPAIGRILAMLPAAARGEAFIEVADAAEIQTLQAPGGVAIRWLLRNGAEPGTTSLLRDAVAASALPARPGVFAWVGAEARAAAEIRAHLLKVRRLEKTQQLVVAYWRRA